MRTIEVTIQDRKYTVKQLPILASRQWRSRFEDPINKVLNVVSGISPIVEKKFDNGKDLLSQVGAVVFAQAGDLLKVLIGSMDIVFDAVLDYSPEIAADRDWIESNAFDEDMVSAFVAILGIAFPFGGLVKTLSNLSHLEEGTPGS